MKSINRLVLLLLAMAAFCTGQNATTTQPATPQPTIVPDIPTQTPTLRTTTRPTNVPAEVPATPQPTTSRGPPVLESPTTTYLDEPVESWRAEFPSMDIGNGVFVSPSGDMVVAVGSNALVRAYQPSNGEVLWTYSPELINGGSISCTSGVNFAYDIDTPFLTYIVNDNVAGVLTTRVIVLSTEGNKIMQSTSLPGEGAGTPKVTRDGSHVIFTSNVNQTGYFSVLHLEGAVADPADPNEFLPLAPIFRYKSVFVQFGASTPFSDVGFYHNPKEGFYVSPNNVGEANTNDIFVWMTATNTKAISSSGTPVAGEGMLYFFQFPRDYQPGSNTTTIDVTVAGGNISRPYQSSTRPILTNSGYSLYWAHSRGEVRSWVNREFNRGHSNLTNLGRGDPAYISARAPPTLSSDPVQPMVFGVGAANLVWKTDFGLGDLVTVATDSIVSSRVAITPDDMYVFYGTQLGDLFMASTANLATRWESGSNITFTSIKGDIAMHPSGSMLYVPDSAGTIAGSVIVALQLTQFTESAMPTASPASNSSSGSPSDQPTGMPTFSEALTDDDTPRSLTPSKSPVATQASPQPTSQVTSGAGGKMKCIFWFNGGALWTFIPPLLMALVVAM